MRVSEISGALLDYWTARAEGIPADQLEIRPQPMGESICVRTWKIDDIEVQKTLAYSTSWEDGGPLLEKHDLEIVKGDDGWIAYLHGGGGWSGPTLLTAVMRLIVFQKFGTTLPE